MVCDAFKVQFSAYNKPDVGENNTTRIKEWKHVYRTASKKHPGSPSSVSQLPQYRLGSRWKDPRLVLMPQARNLESYAKECAPIPIDHLTEPRTMLYKTKRVSSRQLFSNWECESKGESWSMYLAAARTRILGAAHDETRSRRTLTANDFVPLTEH